MFEDDAGGAEKGSAPRSGMQRRGSTRNSMVSASLYGPTVSSRSGRPDYVQSLLSKRPSVAVLQPQDLHVHEEEEEEEEEEEDYVIPAAEQREDEPRVTAEQQRQQRKAIRRLSMQHAPKMADPKKLVQVKLRDFSFFVPVDAMAPSKKTVINQSICYLIYQFFQRLAQLIRPPKNIKEARGRFVARTTSDLFLPFSKKPVLNKLNLVFQPGKTYLILGPPGCGKTTLLKTIAGRLPRNAVWMQQDQSDKDYAKGRPHLSGRIEYNGLTKFDEPSLCLADIVSFVGQLDIHAPYLTVKETFEFARACREGVSSKKENEDKGISENLTIEGLGLGHVGDTFVGNNEVRGVSGGQRRRVTVGEMMQGQNPVACADEISTGLDAAVTYDIVKSIVDFAKAVKTTRIVSLLQPGPETFVLFDELVLLSDGYLVYAGAIDDSVEHFASLGYDLPATMDVADFLQSVTTADGELLFNADKSPHDAHYTPEQFAEAFEQSRHAERIRGLLDAKTPHDWTGSVGDEENGSAAAGRDVPEEFTIEYKNSMMQSLKLNFGRHLTLWKRDKGFIIGKAFENIGMAVATGGILFGQARVPDNWSPTGTPTQDELNTAVKIQDAVYSAFFMTCLHILLGTTTSTPDDIDGRPIHYKQADANFYQSPAFVFGRLISTFPQRALEIAAFGIPLYWFVGLNPTAGGFFLYLAIILAYTFCLKMAYGIIAQILPNKQNVLGFGTFLVLLFSLFGGFIVFPDTIPGYYKWLYYANPFSWAFQGLLIAEFTSSKYSSVSINGIDAPTLFLAGKGFETDRAWIGYAFAFLIPYTILAAAILTVVLKYVRIEPSRASVDKSREKIFGDVDATTQSKEDFNLPFVPVDLTFENLCYEVKPSTGDGMLRLLNNVSGAFKAGRMCALMGSSGAGKTTLMDVIALRKESGVITGEVRMNGFLQERTSFLRSSGYVEQFDVQQAELTVRETVLFCARLRLDSNNPVTATDEGKRRFVDYVLDMMELTDIEDLQIGSYEYGGLTFEQRKRVAIAVELAASPSVIFLDEPTSGLDSRGALVIMRAMKKIADTGRTVCATIHQPSSGVFEMFDDLLLLKRGGEVVFFGELGEESCHLVSYFESRGAAPISHGENPAAWMLRAYSGEDKDVDWKELFEQSEQYETMKTYVASIKESPDESQRITYDEVFAAGWKERNGYMNRRILTIMKRAPSYNLARLMIAILYAFLLGSVFIRQRERKNTFDEHEAAGIFATMFLSLIILGVVSISMAVPVMKDIRDVFYKHRASGMLNHNSVAGAVTLGELPYIVMMAAIFSSVYYATVNLFDSADRWISFFGYVALNLAVYVYFGQAFICLVKDLPTAGALVGALIGYNVFFSGLVVRPQYFKGPFQLGYWSSPGRYAFEGVIVSQFIGLDHNVTAKEGGPFFVSQNCTIGQPCSGTMTEFVDYYFGGRFKESHQPLDVGILVFCLLLARLLCWFALKKFNYVNT